MMLKCVVWLLEATGVRFDHGSLGFWPPSNGHGSWIGSYRYVTHGSSAVVASTHTTRDATLLADAGGRVVVTEDGGRTFAKVPLKQAAPMTGLAEAGEGRLAFTGPRGVAVTETTSP